MPIGSGWRRFTESIRTLPVPSVLQGGKAADQGDMEPTSNARNEKMLELVATFSSHLATMERDLQAVQRQIATQFSSLRNILISPLPCVYDLDEGGRVVPMEEATEIGQHVALEKLEESVVVMRLRMDQDVLTPMREWRDEFRKVQQDMRFVEELRRELDYRKRSVEQVKQQNRTLETKVELKLQSTMRRTGGSASHTMAGIPISFAADATDSLGLKLQRGLEDAAARKLRKEARLENIQCAFADQELKTFKSLAGLVQDAKNLKIYAATALLNLRECIDTACSAFQGMESWPDVALHLEGVQGLEAMAGSDTRGAAATAGTGHAGPPKSFTSPSQQLQLALENDQAQYDQAHNYQLHSLGKMHMVAEPTMPILGMPIDLHSEALSGRAQQQLYAKQQPSPSYSYSDRATGETTY